jgi:hypothetical protein
MGMEDRNSERRPFNKCHSHGNGKEEVGLGVIGRETCKQNIYLHR